MEQGVYCGVARGQGICMEVPDKAYVQTSAATSQLGSAFVRCGELLYCESVVVLQVLGSSLFAFWAVL